MALPLRKPEETVRRRIEPDLNPKKYGIYGSIDKIVNERPGLRVNRIKQDISLTEWWNRLSRKQKTRVLEMQRIRLQYQTHLRNESLNENDIAEKLGISKNAVNLAKNALYPDRETTIGREKIRRQQILEFARANPNMPTTLIAKEFGVSRETVGSIIYSAGFEKRPSIWAVTPEELTRRKAFLDSLLIKHTDLYIKYDDLVSRYTHILEEYGIETQNWYWLRVTSKKFDEKVKLMNSLVGDLWKDPEFWYLLNNSEEYVLTRAKLLESIGTDREFYFSIPRLDPSMNRFKKEDAKDLIEAVKQLKTDPNAYFKLRKYFNNMAQLFVWNKGFRFKLSNDFIKELAHNEFVNVYSKCKMPETNPIVFLAVVTQKIFSRIIEEFKFRTARNTDDYQISDLDEEGNRTVSRTPNDDQY